ncbi:MAG: hypothetical protein M3151_01930 [Actinomycetota bacterium]|nr:hypothetical protein [Actinomycetota bacterium]
MGSGVEFMVWRERGKKVLREAERGSPTRLKETIPGRVRFGGVLGSIMSSFRRWRLAWGAQRLGRRGATAEQIR